MSQAAPISHDREVDLDALRRIDPRLVALALGRIDQDELEELMDRAVREPEVQRAVEAFWPLDEQARQLSFERAQAALTDRRELPRRPHWSLMFLPTTVAVPTVAVLALIVIGLVQPAPLPAYDLEVRGGLRTVRSARRDHIVGRLAPAAPLELVFRPAEAADGHARAALFQFGIHGLVRLDALPEVSDSGSVRWRGTIKSLLPGAHGAVELLVAVRAGNRPPTVEEVRQALRKPSTTLAVARTTLVIDDL